jgi:large subunit ribosomal protein L6
MSRIGKQPIPVPAGVDVTVDGNAVTVKGPKGELSHTFPALMSIALEDGVISVTRPDDERESRSLHGLTRTLIANMVTGVSQGFSKTLEIQGVGYRAAMKGSNLEMQLGLSHPVLVTPPAGITFEVPAPNKVVVSGYDKQKVGQIASEVRGWRPPEPYKGKGVRYEGEYVRRKLGKTAK